ncbi:flippase [Haloferax volcanii]|uniref:flippase n=1 Tax=Haloferax volcanii TaxID=2246 RepID=UPI0009D9778D|nr:flippase [Haloferax alexandrinus]
MTDLGDSLAQLVRGAGIVFVGTVTGKVLALLGQIFVVRSLPPDEFGTIALAFTIVSVASGILVVGAPQGITRLLASSRETKEQIDYLRSGLLISLASGVIGMCAIYVFRDEIQRFTGTSGISGLLAIFSIYVVLSPISRVILGGLRGFKRSTANVFAKNIVGQLGAFLFLIGLLAVGNAYLGLIIYWVSIPLLTIIAGIYLLNQSIRISDLPRDLPTSPRIKNFLSYSWPLALSGSFVLLMSQLDVIMIGLFLSANDVGQYRSIQPLKEVVLFFLTSITFLYLPIATEYFTNGNLSGLNKLYTTSTKWVVTATFPIVLTCVLFPEDIIRTLFSESYLPASTAFVILIVGMFSRVVVGPNGATIQAINESQVEMYASVAGGVSNLILNILLIPRIGIEGAAFATAVGFLTYNLVELIVIYRKTGLVPLSLDVYKPMVLTAAVGIVLVLIIDNIELGVFSLAIITMLFVTVHISSLFVTQSISQEDQLVLEKIEDKTGLNLTILRL